MVRIARASTKKTNIAFCGYHGWHDWYLSANLGNKKSEYTFDLILNLRSVSNNLGNTSF